MVEMDVSPGLVNKGETKGGSPGLSGEPVFARNCYTRFFRTSIENPKKKCSKEDMRGAEEAELFPGRPGYFPVAGLYQDGRTSILVGPTSRVWTRQRFFYLVGPTPRVWPL